MTEDTAEWDFVFFCRAVLVRRGSASSAGRGCFTDPGDVSEFEAVKTLRGPEAFVEWFAVVEFSLKQQSVITKAVGISD